VNKTASVGGMVAAVALLAAACGSSGGGSASAAPGSAPAAAAASAGASAPAASAPSVKLASRGSLGQVLVDGQGRTLYLWEADKSSASTCSGACATAWPPATVTGTPTAGTGINAALLSVTTRSDGARELTYDGHPLYRFVGDQTATDAKGQGSHGFGAGWYVVSAAGAKVDTDDEAATAAPSSGMSGSGGGGGYHY
jgi:predicted lipoprotein with Yx(FWY)xxD motif